ncbi:MAG: hypothetical protein IMZ64_02985, partial [Bacteroidetes bacterium]|nr:hypothetical protein [Bacteroidota bacterium]
MSTVRTKHNKENPFAQINKKSLWDSNLSLEAAGLWARCLSRPDDWEINVKELKTSCKCGENRIYKLLNELIKFGYVYRSQHRTRKGNKSVYGKFQYLVFESKEDMEDFKESLQLDDFQRAEIQRPENGGITNIDCTNTDVKEKKIYKKSRELSDEEHS